MKTSTFINCIFLTVAYCVGANAQQCSPQALAAKYWQYRNNFSSHFIAIDRSTNGCINDGIGQDINDPCICTKAGYSLPATSININNNGAAALKDRKPGPNESQDFLNVLCGDVNDFDGINDDISWNAANQHHNWLDVGSETPHQMGWYWVTLATEYQLLMESGQTEEAQRTLEELFLGLQAYRRLDIEAQCLVKKRYDEITDGFEVENCSL